MTLNSIYSLAVELPSGAMPATFDGAFAEVIEKDTGKVIGARDCRVSGKIGPLKPGAKYVVNFLVQHEDPAKLESIRDGECWLDSELSKSIDVPVYGTAQAAYARDNSSSFKDVRLAPGDKKVAFAAPPDESKLPSEAAPGDLLTGTAGLCRSAANSEGPSRRPAAGLLYTVPPRSNKTAKKDSKKATAAAKGTRDWVRAFEGCLEGLDESDELRSIWSLRDPATTGGEGPVSKL